MASARPRPQVMRLTDAAAERIKAVMAKAERPIAAVRVGVKNGGCAGMSYFMEYAETVNPLDEVIEDKGVRILVDPKAVLFLLGTEMDYKVDKLSAQFTFNNPNQTAACGCGKSVQIEPASRRAGRPAPRRIRRHCGAPPTGPARSGRPIKLRGEPGSHSRHCSSKPSKLRCIADEVIE